MTLKSACHFNLVTVIRCDKIRADQEHDDLGGFKLSQNLFFPCRARTDFSVMPIIDEPLAA
ncbi:MAG: hypothetical protein ETSY2_26080 [Candidatus Entotheonella gemina]|uniref:Uncharacterized protein n=1 Tax=Candidatus Entotheonella gemina TaxID=1429439 RepID=W4M4R4_9BACT|nr:MAG: hypothetical protein ETSY2_26080 [Candidatus Entotheonella gemina]